MMKKATKLEWLEYFYENIDLGPADDDVVDIIKAEFIRDKDKMLPKSYTPYELRKCRNTDNIDHVLEWKDWTDRIIYG